MRRYGIARYLTNEQRERAARATYRLEDIDNSCGDPRCWSKGDTIPAARTANGSCPLGVALEGEMAEKECPIAADVEEALAATGENRAIRRAAARFIHDVDGGKIGPDDVAAALGVSKPPPPPPAGGQEDGQA